MDGKSCALHLRHVLPAIALIGFCACDDTDSGIVEPPALQTVSGSVTYCGSTTKRVSGVIVRVESGGTVYTDTTDATGAFSFASIPPLQSDAQWTLERETTFSDYSAISGLDELWLFRFVNGLDKLDDCQRFAADVNLDHEIDINDAVGIANWLTFGPTTSQTSRWVFAIIPSVGEVEAKTSDARIEFRACMLGDVDMSWPQALPGGP